MSVHSWRAAIRVLKLSHATLPRAERTGPSRLRVSKCAVWISIRRRDTERRGEVKKQRKLHHKSPAALKAFVAEIHLCLSLSPSKLHNVTFHVGCGEEVHLTCSYFFFFFSKVLRRSNTVQIQHGVFCLLLIFNAVFTAGQWLMMQRSSTQTGGGASYINASVNIKICFCFLLPPHQAEWLLKASHWPESVMDVVCLLLQVAAACLLTPLLLGLFTVDFVRWLTVWF